MKQMFVFCALALTGCAILDPGGSTHFSLIGGSDVCLNALTEAGNYELHAQDGARQYQAGDHIIGELLFCGATTDAVTHARIAASHCRSEYAVDQALALQARLDSAYKTCRR